MRKAQSLSGREGEASPEPSSHDRILQAGRKLFAEDGYENTTTSAIARKAGTSGLSFKRFWSASSWPHPNSSPKEEGRG